jgi:cytochrome c553
MRAAMRAAVVLLLLAGPAAAQGVVDRGRAVAQNGTEGQGDQAGVAPCSSCHGMDGLANGNTQFPRLDGQPGIYLASQLEDYASGSRQNEIMTPIAQSLSRADREATAAYFASLRAGTPPPPAEAPAAADPKQVERGRTIVDAGLAPRAVQACVSCHGPDAAGQPPAIPRLAGQWAPYAVAQFRAFRDGTRHNDVAGVMRGISHRLNDADVAAVAAYLQGLQPAD